MTTPHLTERRVRNLEERVGNVEDTLEAHEKTLYGLCRDVTGLKLNMGKLIDHFGIAPATEQEIDAVLDVEEPESY